MPANKYDAPFTRETYPRWVYDYTIDNWGYKQADKYTDELTNRFKWLAENPHLGTKRDEVKEGYLSYFQGKHTIFYRETRKGIEIIGIPHQNEDVIQHFDMDNTQ